MSETDLSELMGSCSKGTYVSDVVNYAEDIEPHNLIYLWAGVGAGKNTFIEDIMKGRNGFPKLTVLLISSRKSKVVETLHHFNDVTSAKMTNGGNCAELYARYGYIPEEYCKSVLTDTGEICEVIQQNVVCTNAYIEKYHKHIYDPQKPETHLWNRFDLIVCDEAHSLIMDSTYQSAPFYVASLIKETFLRIETNMIDESYEWLSDCISPRCRKLMLMTGTPEALETAKFLPSPHIIDLRAICSHVMPENVYFVDSVQAELQIQEQLSEGERVVYFTNHVVYPEDAAKKYAVPRDRLAVSFSDDMRRASLKNDSGEKKDKNRDYERMERAEQYLASHERLPEDVQLFITTSRNKEGVNIKDENIRHVYIESHCLTDIIQMTGRIRCGAENVYIVLDAAGFSSNEHYLECTVAKQLAEKTLGGMT